MATGNKTRTGQSGQDWVVEFYPFQVTDPIDLAGSGLDPSSVVAPIGIGVKAKTDLTKIKQALNDSGIFVDEQKIFVQKGLTSLSFIRNKKNPDAPLTMTFVGPMNVPHELGTWVVISTISGESSPKQLIRFVGQIHTISTNYTTHQSGLVGQMTVLQVRSWSAALLMPVRFDVFAIQQAAAQDPIGQMAIISNIAGENFDINTYIQIVRKNYNAFEFAHLVLSLVGCLNADDSVEKIKGINNAQFPDVALTMPSVPELLLKRLGFSGLNSTNPFYSKSGPGFAKVITGILKKGYNNDGSWNGVFNSAPEIPSLSILEPGNLYTDLPASPLKLESGSGIDEFKSIHNQNPKIRPASAAAGHLIGIGVDSAWEILTKYADPALHEVFADILYEKSDFGILAKPVIFVRDRPFLLRTIVDNHSTYGLTSHHADLIKDNWTFYDDLPRVRISDVHIMAISSTVTAVNSPNLLRFNFHSMIGAPDFARQTSSLRPIRHTNQMRRFGGREHYIATQYYPIFPDSNGVPGITQEDWIEATKGVCSAWHSFNYRMPDMSLVMKDDSSAITVGLNVQFSFGGNEFVGHVESITSNFTVHPSGVEETRNAINLSRVVMVNQETGKLEFIPMNMVASLNKVIAVKPVTEVSPTKFFE